jgi:ketosteroid isomerase-like protein
MLAVMTTTEAGRADLLREINRDIWHPFRATYAALDAAGFLALSAPDFIRASAVERAVYGRAEYAAAIEPFFARVAERGDKIAIDFRFRERLAGPELASERGVFELRVLLADGEQRVRYGQFHTYARKVEGRWRFVADYDSDEGATITAETYAAGTAIDDVEPHAG